MARRTPQPLVAAAVRPNLSSRKNLERDIGLSFRREQQDHAWDAFDAVGEVKHGVWGMANIVSKIRLFVAVMDEDGDTPVPLDARRDDNDEPIPLAPVHVSAVAELHRLRSEQGGQGEILREASMNLDIAGEFHIVGWGARDEQRDHDGNIVSEGLPEQWEVVSISEVTVRDGKTYIAQGPGDRDGREMDPERDTIIRIWQRHPRWSAVADSHVIGCLDIVEQLKALHLRELSENNARHSRGLFTLPNELTVVQRRRDDDDPDDDEADPLTDAIDATWSEPIGNPGSPNFTAPTIIRGPAEFLKSDYLRHVEVPGDDLERIDARVEAKVKRLARSLNMPLEFVLGHQGTTFSNAGQVDHDEFTDYVQPRVELICDALTNAFLRPNLRDTFAGDGDEISRMFVWYDPAAVLPSADMTEKAEKAKERDLISDSTYREALGFTEEDAERIDVEQASGMTPADAERIALLAQKLYLGVGVLMTAEEARRILVAAGADLTGDLATESADDPPADDTTDDADTGDDEPSGDTASVTASAGHASNAGRRLVDLDRDLRARLLVAADDAVTRAIERAGNRLRGQGQLRARLRNVAAEDCAATLGRALVADAMPVPDLIDGAFDRLRGQFMAWGGIAQEEALAIVGQIVGGFDPTERAGLMVRAADNLEEAWGWAEGALRSLTEAKLFDPSFALETVGEALDRSVVPPGIIRQAVARAGGAAHVATDGTSAWVVAAEYGGEPMGGIGTGDLTRSVLRDHGASVEGWLWSYGPALRSRPFEPHVRLDGLTFTDLTDQRLAVQGTFPPTGFYTPGDHAGCNCDLVPVIIDPDGGTTADY